MEYCKTDVQAADIFTKALPPQKWGPALRLLGIRVDLPPELKDHSEGAASSRFKSGKPPVSKSPTARAASSRPKYGEFP